MGEFVFKLPDVGEGVAEAELVEWHVKVGDLVREDAPLAAVMTDKATVEIPSPAEGEIVWLAAEMGDLVAVGSDLVRLKIAETARSPLKKARENLPKPRPRLPAPRNPLPPILASPRPNGERDRVRGDLPQPEPQPSPPHPSPLPEGRGSRSYSLLPEGRGGRSYSPLPANSACRVRNFRCPHPRADTDGRGRQRRRILSAALR